MQKKAAHPDGTLFARARPESIWLKERYWYEREFSSNPMPGKKEPPTGRIEVRVPYDGRDFFTREAWEDVKPRLAESPDSSEASCRIGHLLLHGYHHTNLASLLDLSEHHGAVALDFPIRGGHLMEP